MSRPVLFHDPTSEPSRAVFWLAAEAGFEIDIEYTWLSRDGHLAPEFLAVNPGHQVPAMAHDGLHISEASAIMYYLVDLHETSRRWIGETPGERANTHRLVSWHHSNTRRRLTLDYFLPALLMPAYHGTARPSPEELATLRLRGRESLELLEDFLEDRGPFLGGQKPNIADFFIAPDLFALDIDPERETWFNGFHALSRWLEDLRGSEGYNVSHRSWNHIVPRLRTLVTEESETPRNNRWVADACMSAPQSGRPNRKTVR